MGKQTKLTHYYNQLKICHSCFKDSVLSYEQAIDTGDVFDVCELCGNFGSILLVKYVTVLGTKRLKVRKSLNTSGVFK